MCFSMIFSKFLGIFLIISCIVNSLNLFGIPGLLFVGITRSQLSVDSGAGSGDWSQVGSGQGTCSHRLGELMGTHRIWELVQHRSQQPVGFHQVCHPEGT